MSKKTDNPSKLLWLDMEMTGLDADKDRILEVAAVITDWDFAELATFEAVVHQPVSVINSMSEWARQHHDASGLTANVADGMPEHEAEDALVQIIKAQVGDEPILLAGNSIHQDRRFIRRWWPKLEKTLHYRMLDVTAWKVVMMGRYGIAFDKKETHRALDDIHESMTELQFYLQKAKVR